MSRSIRLKSDGSAAFLAAEAFAEAQTLEHPRSCHGPGSGPG